MGGLWSLEGLPRWVPTFSRNAYFVEEWYVYLSYHFVMLGCSYVIEGGVCAPEE